MQSHITFSYFIKSSSPTQLMVRLVYYFRILKDLDNEHTCPLTGLILHVTLGARGGQEKRREGQEEGKKREEKGKRREEKRREGQRRAGGDKARQG